MKPVEPEYECNCEDLRTCRDLYGNKHGAITELMKRKAKRKRQSK
jgi:hypothetical protein